MIIVVVIVKSEVANMLEQHCCLAKRVSLNMYVQTMHIIPLVIEEVLFTQALRLT